MICHIIYVRNDDGTQKTQKMIKNCVAPVSFNRQEIRAVFYGKAQKLIQSCVPAPEGMMTDRELKRMSRAGLLELLSEQSRELDRLREENERLSERLRDREILIRESGSIAEAALKLNGVFEAAQSAADQYIRSVRHISARLPEMDSEG